MTLWSWVYQNFLTSSGHSVFLASLSNSKNMLCSLLAKPCFFQVFYGNPMAAHGPWAACRRPADFVDRRMDSKDLQPFASCGDGQKFGRGEAGISGWNWWKTYSDSMKKWIVTKTYQDTWWFWLILSNQGVVRSNWSGAMATQNATRGIPAGNAT